MIRKAGKPRPRPIPDEGPTEARRLGGLEGQIRMSENFDEEDEELIEAIEDSNIFPDDD